MRRLWSFLLVVFAVVGVVSMACELAERVAWAQAASQVNQGSPGKFGSWWTKSGTTTTVIPTQVSVATAAGGTKVFASDASICSVVVINESSAAGNVVTCGQTSAVTDGAIGIPLLPSSSGGAGGGSYSLNNYGGDVYCIAHAASAIVGVQPTKCQ